jgi:hypothetical protein
MNFYFEAELGTRLQLAIGRQFHFIARQFSRGNPFVKDDHTSLGVKTLLLGSSGRAKPFLLESCYIRD